jgi:hypothetical protein
MRGFQKVARPSSLRIRTGSIEPVHFARTGPLLHKRAGSKNHPDPAHSAGTLLGSGYWNKLKPLVGLQRFIIGSGASPRYVNGAACKNHKRHHFAGAVEGNACMPLN